MKIFEEIIYNEKYSSLNSIIQKIDSRVKIFSSIALISIAILAKSILTLIILMSIIFILSMLSRIPLKFFLIRTSLIPLFVTLIALPLIFITPGNQILNLNFISITTEGIHKALLFILRVWTCVNSLILLTLTTKFSSIINATENLKIPKIFTMMISITYRFIFLSINEAYRMLLAKELRTFKKESRLKTIKTLASMFSTLFIRSYERGERVYLAMMARGYKGSMNNLKNTSINRRDVAFILIITSVCIMTISSEHFLGVL
ncbi:MAG: cobalt ECF transporter T component CbiQ [Nitrososphaerales archaeon]